MAVALAETLEAGLDELGGDSFAFASWTPGSNEQCVLLVHSRDKNHTSSLVVSGNGLTWTAEAAIDDGDSIKMWVVTAQGGSPSAGVVTVTTTGSANCWGGLLTRWTDTDTSDGVEAVLQAASPTLDNADPTLTITTQTDNAVVFALIGCRSRTYTLQSGETLVGTADITYGAVGDRVKLHGLQISVPSTADQVVGAVGSLSFTDDWIVSAVSIKPSGGTVVPVIIHHRKTLGVQ